MPGVKIIGLHHLMVHVSDLDRAVAFYEAIGMERMRDGERIRWMKMGPNEIHLMQTDEPIRGFRDEPSPHFAIQADPGTDIHEWARRIPELGGELLQEPRRRSWGPWYLFALDPDGNRFEITQDA